MPRRPVLVQKFGGTSVATPETRRLVVEHVRFARDAGFEVAVVVSAMGRRGDPYATDSLLDLLRADGGSVEPRDYDLIFACGEAISAAVMSQTLRRAGIPATALTSAQAGIFTDGAHQEAEITRIETSRLRSLLAGGEVPVITGAQGVAPDSLDYTTLGRGGSDTSGVAVGVALGAQKVEIFTDVEGVATTDPRLIRRARLLRHISFPSMHEMARFGATVVHPRAIGAGWRAGTPIVVRSTFANDPGTLIDDTPDGEPLVGLAALTPFTTTVLPANSVDGPTRERWERRGVLSIYDEDRHALVVGTAAESTPELDRALAGSAIDMSHRIQNTCWLSVIGDGSRHVYPPLSHLLGPRVLFAEDAERRATYVIPLEARAAAAEALYAAVFEPA